jgi:acyl carrier protein
MKDLQQIQDTVKQTIIDVLEMEGVTPADIDNDAPFFGTEEEPGIIQDSLAILEISTVLGEEFDIIPTEFNEEAFQNVNTLSAMIQRNLLSTVA